MSSEWWIELPKSLAGLAVEGWPAWLALAIVALLALLLGRLRRRPEAGDASGTAFRSLGEHGEAFEAELARARRYDRGFAMIVVSLEDRDVMAAMQRWKLRTEGRPSVEASRLLRAAREVVFFNAGHLLQDVLREHDVAACDFERRHYVALLPEADSAGAREMARRTAADLSRRLGVPVRRGIAVFREDGVTIADLVAVARERMSRISSVPSEPQRADDEGLDFGRTAELG